MHVQTYSRLRHVVCSTCMCMRNVVGLIEWCLCFHFWEWCGWDVFEAGSPLCKPSWFILYSGCLWALKLSLHALHDPTDLTWKDFCMTLWRPLLTFCTFSHWAECGFYQSSSPLSLPHIAEHFFFHFPCSLLCTCSFPLAFNLMLLAFSKPCFVSLCGERPHSQLNHNYLSQLCTLLFQY